jgi:hypothetical protein
MLGRRKLLCAAEGSALSVCTSFGVEEPKPFTLGLGERARAAWLLLLLGR